MLAKPKSLRAFSLVELMAVMAIIAILSVIAAPSVFSIFAAKNLDNGVYSLSSAIEQARSEAMTRQTYVWMGIASVPTPTGLELQVGMVGSKDGTGTNTNSTNLSSLRKVIHLSNVSPTEWSNLKSSTQGLFTNAVPASLSTNAAGITFTSGQTQFTGTTLTFTPQGEVLLKGAAKSDDGYNAWIDISIRQSHGSTVATGADDASILIEGATGNVKVVALQ